MSSVDVATTVDDPGPDPGAIADRVRREAGVVINDTEATRVAHLLTSGRSAQPVDIEGRDIVTGLPSRCSLTAEDLLGP